MGQIMQEVRKFHLYDYPSEVRLLTPFLNDFSVTWGKRRRLFGSDLSLYFLRPSNRIRDQFGFDSELLLVVSTYRTLEPRLFQAVEQVMDDSPGKGRVNQRVFFLITEYGEAKAWLNSFIIDTPQECMPVAFIAQDLLERASDSWFVRNEIMSQMYTRDLFNVQLPIKTDLSFFGRGALVTDFVQSISQARNLGLFGLRKTGKTSFLFKVRRQAVRQGCEIIYFDCKNPAIRSQDWGVFLNRICNEIRKLITVPTEKQLQAQHISDQFIALLRSTPNKMNICLIFDEIEYISPIAKLDKHWHSNFLPFWQTLWTAQSELRRLSFIVAGVNPSVVELHSIGGVQNPMFGIVPARYLRGFERDELATMIRTIGRRIGLRFSSSAIDYMFQRYGGHPLLTRMACSHVHSKIELDRENRPFDIGDGFLRSSEQQREEELSYYSGHVVSELQEFYPEEYELLEALASGNEADFVEYERDVPEFVRHLRDYGLVESNGEGRPRIKISVVQKYVSYQSAKDKRTKMRRYVISGEQRKSWLNLRLQSIRNELDRLGYVIRKEELPTLYGKKGFPETERFLEMDVVEDQKDFLNFINTCNRCLVESLDHGRSIDDIRHPYPDLWDALKRVKSYRVEEVHRILTPKTQANLNMYLERDLDGKKLAEIEDGYFILQQAVIDNLFSSILYELNRHS